MSWIPALARAARYGALVARGRLAHLNRPFQATMTGVRQFGSSRLRPSWENQALLEAREAARLSRLRSSLNPWRPQGRPVGGGGGGWPEFFKDWGSIGLVGAVGSAAPIAIGATRIGSSKLPKQSAAAPSSYSVPYDGFFDRERSRVFAGSERKRVREGSQRSRRYKFARTADSGLQPYVPYSPRNIGPPIPFDPSGSGVLSGAGGRRISFSKIRYDYN